MPVLEVQDLSVTFTRYTSGLRQQQVKVVDGLGLAVEAGEIMAVIGSSGSGKSLLAHAVLGILPDNAAMNGAIAYNGERLDAAKQEALRGKEIVLVPQSVAYLDPLMRVGEQVRASVRDKRKDAAAVQRKAFRRYRLDDQVERMYPFELSGGMARRVLISTATVNEAKLIVADEPTPGLHPADVQEALLRFRELADEGSAVLLITHDIESALSVADKVAVLYAGTILEIANAEDFAGDGSKLRHPYSQALWRALPQNGFQPLEGSQPQPGERMRGCVFAPRCSQASEECLTAGPDMRAVRQGMVRCIHAT